MIRIGLSAVAGLTGWAARLLFVSGIGCTIAGLYIALFKSLGERDPGHLWLLGLLVMGFGAAGSFTGFIGVFILRPNRNDPPVLVDPEWYSYPWMLLIGAAVALLCLSCGLRLVGDWERSNVRVTATVSGCANESDTTYSCTYAWDWNGVHHQQGRAANGQYEDGHPVQLRIDPVTGGADDHSLTDMVYSFIGAGAIGLFDLLLCVGIGLEVADRRQHFRRWLTYQAWWRRLPDRRRPVPEPSAEPVIEDARPPSAGVVEDARPPGY
ncbi:MAG TPA: hypothetical protein VFU73_04035 [Actinocrinis sp.]|nr:hypothetical protein [Actinocrinis sp.]